MGILSQVAYRAAEELDQIAISDGDYFFTGLLGVLGGASFVRVDVPQDGKKKGWKLTKMYNPSAIYSITPVTEETARLVVTSVSGEPITRWDVQDMVANAKKALRPAPVDEEEEAFR